MVEQVIQHFDHLGGLLTLLKENKLINDLIGDQFEKVKGHPRIREIEALTKAYDSAINKYAGEDRQFTKMDIPN